MMRVAPIQLDDARAADALREILVGRADQHALDARVRGGRCRRRRQRIVGLELDHRPDGDAERRQRLFEQRELREEVGVDALAGLVAGPQIVAERLDHVVGRDADVRARRR